MTTSPNPYRGFRFSAEVTQHAVWLYHCFSLSLREVETILAARDVVVSYESIREWGLRFGRLFASTLKRRRPKPGDKWHLDGVFLRIQGKTHHLWRAVDQHGHVLNILVQSRRSAKAAKRFKSARHTQRFLSTHSRIHNHFQLRRHPLTADQQRVACDAAFRTWREVAGVASAA